MSILVTGAAGFIGFHLSQALLSQGLQVIGLDNINHYYDPNLKTSRLKELEKFGSNFKFIKLDLINQTGLEDLFKIHKISKVAHLAAQAGVRYSIENPHVYIDSNITGFLNILENCRHYDIQNLVYASTSSVYGANTAQPFSENNSTEHPMSLYAATKKANEMMAHTYSSLFKLPTTGLRFFTVYGPWGRPDMALFLFTKAILSGEKLEVFNNGHMVRDFTYVDDIVGGIIKALENPAQPDPNWDSNHPNPSTSYAPYKIYNIGNNQPIQLLDYIKAIEKSTNKKAILNFKPMQPGDVPSTCADISKLQTELNYHPKISVAEGIDRFVTWYRTYFKI